MENSEYTFSISISDGYSFRNLIEYLKITNSTGNLIFKPNGIMYQNSNVDGTILNEFNLRAEDLPTYKFYSEGEITVGVNLNGLRLITKPIGRKDSIRMYMKNNDEKGYLYLHINSAKSIDRENVSFIQPEYVDNVKYIVEGYTRQVGDPNLSIQSQQFTKIFSTINSLKCVTCGVKVFESGIAFEGIKSNGTSGHIERYGDCGRKPDGSIDINDDIGVGEIGIKTNTIKAMTKLGNLSHNDSIKLYMEKDLPLKIVTNIGSYGKLTIYIRDGNTE
jgi:hypothetical protein